MRRPRKDLKTSASYQDNCQRCQGGRRSPVTATSPLELLPSEIQNFADRSSADATLRYCGRQNYQLILTRSGWRRTVLLVAGFEVLLIGAGVAGWMAAHSEYCHHTAYLADERCLSYQAVVLFTAIIGQINGPISPLITALATTARQATQFFSKCHLIRQGSWLPSNRSPRWCQPRARWVVTIAHALGHVGSNQVSRRDQLISAPSAGARVRTRWS